MFAVNSDAIDMLDCNVEYSRAKFCNVAKHDFLRANMPDISLLRGLVRLRNGEERKVKCYIIASPRRI